MIRINLLGVERQKKVRTTSTFLDAGQRTTFMCVGIFGLTAMGIGAWYWQLTRQASSMTTQISVAQAEVARLNKVLVEVKRAEDRRGQLQQRVAIIEELRRGQSVPVQMLDHVSRSLPDALWLTSLEQKPDAVSIEGQTTTLISLADFVANLGTNKLVAKPIDIIDSKVESNSSSSTKDQAQAQDVIKFSVRAPLAPAPTTAKGPAAAVTPAAAPGAPR
jgi:type IV pilus assembly protein PilN